MTSGEPGTVARCRYCGREFDVRRFQVRLLGGPSVYDSTECALLDDLVELPPHPDARTDDSSRAVRRVG